MHACIRCIIVDLVIIASTCFTWQHFPDHAATLPLEARYDMPISSILEVNTNNKAMVR